MSESDWLEHWRGWLRARFGERLDEALLAQAAQSCEALRNVWGPLLEADEDNAELPFPNPLPPRDGGDLP